MQIHSFICEYRLVSASFVKKTIHSELNSFGILYIIVKNKLTIGRSMGLFLHSESYPNVLYVYYYASTFSLLL